MQTYPFVFVLMSRKTEVAYKHIFDYINSNIISLECASMMTDFELSMRNAFTKLVPTTEMFCCWFHFCQAMKKRASQCNNMISYIKSNPDATEIYYKIMALPLLPPDMIASQFHALKARAITNHKAAFQTFIRYFEEQWLNKVPIW